MAMPQDPFTYVGRVKRSNGGRVEYLEVFGPDDEITVTNMDEFITFTTVVDLMAPREIPGENNG